MTPLCRFSEWIFAWMRKIRSVVETFFQGADEAHEAQQVNLTL